eukprot:TRINITY_DN71451_c0_g1_i1.p1 TRINITY_DN71451_c0_g1~~TRINITY_DN71451_c0_g1_i1.p1  ORF type:complete len:437 (+),score=94.34 TRINITY_DN71451_c0_g1_i1:157-1467(+)
MEMIISQVHTLSTRNDSDLKKLKDFLRHEQESLNANVGQIDQALQALDPAQHTMGIAFLLAAQCAAGGYANPKATFAYIGNFLRFGDEYQMKKASTPVNTVCRAYAQMAIEDGKRAMLASITPLRRAVEKLRPDPETLTPVHADYLRVCLKVKAYHLGAQLLDQPIFDIAMATGPTVCPQLPVASFLCYFYYGAMIRIGLKEYNQALQLLRVALTCPASCLSAIQADAYKKYVLVSLKVNGELVALPVYSSSIVQRYAKSPGYATEIADAFKLADAEALQTVVTEKAPQIQADGNMGLVKQVVESLHRHKVQRLTKTYLTLSVPEILRELALPAGPESERKVEELLFDMISCGEIKARIDQVSGMVSFDEENDEELDAAMASQLEGRMAQILELAARVSAFEQEVVSSQAYIRKTAAVQFDRPAGAAMGAYDSMDM